MADPKTESKPSAEPTFYALIKNVDGESIKPITESEFGKLADPTKVELFQTQAEAEKRKGEIAFARVVRTRQIAGAKAKTAKQRVAFALKNPEAARKLSFKEREAYAAHLAALEKDPTAADLPGMDKLRALAGEKPNKI